VANQPKCGKFGFNDFRNSIQEVRNHNEKPAENSWLFYLLDRVKIIH